MIKKEKLVGFIKEGAIEDFYELNTTAIGSGAFGNVIKAKLKGTKQVRAVKKIAKAKVTEHSSLFNEIEILQKLDHPNIVKFFESYQDHRFIYIVMEYCTGGELFDKIVEKRNFSELQSREVIHSLVQALHYCHGMGIVHRDIKPENVLLRNKCEDSEIKLIDFGLAKKYNSSDTKKKVKLAGTSYYVSPESIDKDFGPYNDVWSVGVLLYILLTGVPPFNGEQDDQILRRIKKGAYKLDPLQESKVSREVVDLVGRILVRDKSARLDTAGILEHVWFKESIIYSPIKFNMDNFRKFAYYSSFKKLGLSMMATQISGEEVEELTKIFKSMDVNSDGVLERREVEECLRLAFGDGKDFEKVLEEIDTDHNGKISYNQFLACTLKSSTTELEENLRMVFRMFDLNNNGKISKAELSSILEDFGNESKMKDIILEADKNGDGEIDYEQFLALMKN